MNARPDIPLTPGSDATARSAADATRVTPVTAGPVTAMPVAPTPAPVLTAPSAPAPTASPAGTLTAAPTPAGNGALLGAAAAGAGLALALGLYGRLHVPTGEAVTTFAWPSLLAMKIVLATAAAALVVVQLGSALWMWGRLPGAGKPPAWLAPVHRWSGTVAFVLTLPVAYHCIWSLGLRIDEPRVLIHGLAGCAFYGVFTAKMLALRARTLPALALPVLGGALVALLVGAWLTSALWYLTTAGFAGA
jgi:hypothetical protein